MKRTLILIVLATAVAVPRFFGDVIYNVTFEDPPHSLNTAVVSGSGSDRPIWAVGSVIARSGVADFTSQVASFEPAGQLGFYSVAPPSTGLVLLSWDMALTAFGPGGPDTAAVLIQTSPSGNGSMSMFWQTDNDFRIGSTEISSFTLGEQDHYEFLFDLDNDQYDFAFNGVALLTNQLLDASFDVQNVLFGAENLRSPSYAVDNFRWEVVPEPSTWLLISTGCLAAVYGRRLLETKAAGP